MKTLKVIFTVLLAFYTIPTVLATLDIYKGTEPDLTSEWMILFIFFIMFIGLISVNLTEILKKELNKYSDSCIKILSDH